MKVCCWATFLPLFCFPKFSQYGGLCCTSGRNMRTATRAHKIYVRWVKHGFLWQWAWFFIQLPFHCLSDALKDGKELNWTSSMYPDLHMPFAPSWSLHWAYRDGHLVNLPVSLLVEGDIVALRPGQESYSSLRGIKVTYSDICKMWLMMYKYEH